MEDMKKEAFTCMFCDRSSGRLSGAIIGRRMICNRCIKVIMEVLEYHGSKGTMG